jgi:hypothetical protein
VRAPDAAREGARALLGGEAAVPGPLTYSAPIGAINDVSEAAKLGRAVGDGDIETAGRSIAQQMTPGFQTLYELAMGRDLLTDEEIDEPLKRAIARTGFNASAPIPRITGPLIDTIANKLAPGTLPARFSGQLTDVDPNSDQTLGRLALGATGLNPRTPGASQAARNVMDSPKVRDLKRALKTSRRNRDKRTAIRRYSDQ